ncbi:YjgN family protein [Magnetospira thiophila]
MEESVAITEAVVPEQNEGLDFTGRRAPLFGLLLKNTLLTLITVGIYRFWAKTHLRRYFWNHLRLGDDHLEYLGTGGELFKGFLFALIILFPIGMFYGLVLQFIGSPDEALYQVVNASQFLVYFMLAQIAIFRLTRYRLSRTAWRGVRFGLDGKSLEYLKIALLWSLLTLLTLGVAYPWMRVALTRYKATHARFGEGSFGFELAPGAVKTLLLPWLSYLGCLLLAFALVSFGIFMIMTAEQTETPLDMEMLGLGGISVAILIFLSFVPYYWYRVREARLIVGALAFEQARFFSHIRFGMVALLGILTGLASIALLLFLVVSPLMGLSATDESQTAVAFGMAYLGLIGFIFLQNILVTLVLVYPLLRHFCQTFESTGLEPLKAVAQSSAPYPLHGEGLADGLDVGAF